MEKNLSVKNVPNEVVERLRERAKRNHRSLQGELMAILESAALSSTVEREKLSVQEVYERAQKLGLKGTSDSTKLIREARDAGYSR